MIALVGSGEYLPPMQPVDRYLLDQLDGDRRVVCLPTAAGAEGDDRIAYWSELGVRHFQSLGAQVEALPVIDAPSANDPELARQVREAGFVYLSGGNPYYLHQTLAGSRVWEAVQAVLARGDVLAGCSAGAMIMGQRIPGIPRWREAFGLLPNVLVLPHYDEIPRGAAKMARYLTSRKMTLVGVEGSTALIKNGDAYRVMGTGGVVVWNSHGRVRYTHGEQPLIG